ncbi:MAG: bifunctional diaminohydroxyphosphoribosylaminopyrimidine deaminase/5-amino-6-(5-phosphoribosylamino)uracil reductase RibD [Kiritimatiellia bacterium]
MPSLSPEDACWLSLALTEAQVYVGQTSPNPAVGAVVVRNSAVLGKGAHLGAGGPHAEVQAVSACTEDLAGATLYVTLEPCSTTGRTPPCCDLICAKKFARVVIGCLDPNPKHAGRAIEILQSARIEVVVAEGEIAKRCQEMIAPFAKRMIMGLPYLRLKLAMTLDGAIADRSGKSQWISGEEARAWVQSLRARVDAVMVGAGTVRADHPSLQSRLPRVPLKQRILVDRSHPLPEADCLQPKTWVATKDLGYDGVHLESLLREICSRGINDVLCEGGGQLAGALLDAGLVDELWCLYAPKILGDRSAHSGFEGLHRTLPNAVGLTLVSVRQLGSDVLLQYHR